LKLESGLRHFILPMVVIDGRCGPFVHSDSLQTLAGFPPRCS